MLTTFAILAILTIANIALLEWLRRKRRYPYSASPTIERNPMLNPIHNHLNVTVCTDADDAATKGFNYAKDGTRPIEVKQVVVVRSGTQGGNPTVDFLLEDEHGHRFVFMVTGNLLKSIPC